MTYNQKFLKYLPAVATVISVVSIPYQFMLSSWLQWLWGVKDVCNNIRGVCNENYGWEAVWIVLFSYGIGFVIMMYWLADEKPKTTHRGY